jgi:hypothetical protein
VDDVSRTDDVIDLRALEARGRLLDACPACRCTDLTPVAQPDTVNLWCSGCHRCWHVALGRVTRVNPKTCEGCRHHDRCVAVYESDHTTTPG